MSMQNGRRRWPLFGPSKNGKGKQPPEAVARLTYTDPQTKGQVHLEFDRSTLGELREPSIPGVVDTDGETCDIWIRVDPDHLESISKPITPGLLLGHPEFAGVFVGHKVWESEKNNFLWEVSSTGKVHEVHTSDFVQFCIQQRFIDTVLRFLYCWHLDVFHTERSTLTGNEVLECKFLKEWAEPRKTFEFLIDGLRKKCREPAISNLKNKRFYNFYLLINILRNHLDASHVPFRYMMAAKGGLDLTSLYSPKAVESYLHKRTAKDEDKSSFRSAAIAIAVPLLECISGNKNTGALGRSIEPLDQKQKDALQKFITRFTQADVLMELEMAFILPKFQDLFPHSNDPLFYGTLPTVKEFIQENISQNTIFLELVEDNLKIGSENDVIRS